MSVTSDFIKYLRGKGHTVEDLRGSAIGGKGSRRALSTLRRGGQHWDGVPNGTIQGHERHWRDTMGWNTGGYTAFVPNSGIIQVNYDFEVVTNGVGGHNTPTLNFCYGGDWSNPMNAKQKQALKDMWTFVINDSRIGINSYDSVWGHREFSGHASNSCPGINMNDFRAYLKSGKNISVETKPSGSSSSGLQGAVLVKNEEGQFTVTASNGIKVRNAPSTRATHTGSLLKGDKINYNAVYEGNGYRWLGYKGSSGSTLYVPYRTSSNANDEWGTFSKIQKAGWVKDNTGWWYRREGGSYPKDGWSKIGGKWYLFDSRGYMLTGWQKHNDKWYYMDISGVMKTGWLKNGSHWYYLDTSGAMRTGWLLDGETWYYLDANGAMKTGWVKDGETWYYLGSSGVMLTGLINVDGKNYYLERNGALITDEVIKLEANKHGHLRKI